MKIITWNLNNRKANQSAWDKLFALAPDLVLLSEVNFIPEDLKGYSSHFEPAMGSKGEFRSFQTGLICKGNIGEAFKLESKYDWATKAITDYPGNYVCRKVKVDNQAYQVISVHMPSWEFPIQNYTDDASAIALPNYAKIYMSELLWSALKNMVPSSSANWIIGGDFNTSEYIGGTTQRAANVEAIARIEKLGLIETVRRHNGRPVPSFKPTRKNTEPVHQLDHLYISEHLLAKPFTGNIGAWEEYIGAGLSDHAPIIAEIDTAYL